MEKHIRAITMPGIHERFFDFFRGIAIHFHKPRILEIGAGHGAFTKRIYEEGYDVSACDLFPEIFHFDKVKCRKADITEEIPFESDYFDIIVAVEVMEHIHDHGKVFEESHRLLKKDGVLVFSTPNILSLKSRIRFLFAGFFYSFKPLDHYSSDGLQHLSSRTVDQYMNIALNKRFRKLDFAIDKRQATSKLYLFLIPFLWLYCKLKSIDYHTHNRFDYLTGRILFACFWK
jgi:2-polyprenyl-3-methyl-5-hydroxy-6-metoxy-1,4-benzoquinol methylase